MPDAPPSPIYSPRAAAFDSLRRGGADLGLLGLRAVFGGLMLVGHGWPKFVRFRADPSSFPDPLGLGGTMSFYGAVGAEVVCAALVVLGFATRLACLPLVFAMAVAAFVIHANDPFFLPGPSAKEPAFVYLAAFAGLALTGPGRLSLDHLLLGRRSPA